MLMPFDEEHESRLYPLMYDAVSVPGRGAQAMVTVMVYSE